jgi:hypothetical protein
VIMEHCHLPGSALELAQQEVPQFLTTLKPDEPDTLKRKGKNILSPIKKNM